MKTVTFAKELGLIEEFFSTTPHWGVLCIYAIVIFVANDFAHFVMHWIKHNVSWVWEFHKVHHSAKVMTPFAYYRSHPVEDFLATFFPAIFAGVVAGTFQVIVGYELYLFKVYGISFVYIPFMVTNHLNHSHIPVSFGKYLDLIFVSPQFHQVHHSNSEKVLSNGSVNYGRFLTIWDIFLGTRFNTTNISTEKLPLGLSNEEESDYKTVGDLYFMPFKKLFKKLAS